MSPYTVRMASNHCAGKTQGGCQARSWRTDNKITCIPSTLQNVGNLFKGVPLHHRDKTQVSLSLSKSPTRFWGAARGEGFSVRVAAQKFISRATREYSLLWKGLVIYVRLPYRSCSIVACQARHGGTLSGVHCLTIQSYLEDIVNFRLSSDLRRQGASARILVDPNGRWACTCGVL